jgi:hypothetical protein
MRTIWKYQLDVTDVQRLAIKRGAQILTVQAQNGVPCIWAVVDPSEPSEVRTFCMYGTGHRITEEIGQYIGTFQLHDGNLVFHLFEVPS